MASLAPLITLVAVAAITPGPNNLIVLDAASRGGFRRALPVIAGVVAGSLMLLGFCMIGLESAFVSQPMLRSAFTVAGCLYLGWLGAAMIRHAGRLAPSQTVLPNTFLGVCVFQFLNPKGWVLIMTAIASSAREPSSSDPLTLALVVATVTIICLAAWALIGSWGARWLERITARRWFDRIMGAALILSAAALSHEE